MLIKNEEQSGLRSDLWAHCLNYFSYFSFLNMNLNHKSARLITLCKRTFTHFPFPKAVVSSETAKHGRQVYLQANEPLIVGLQANWRGYLARKSFNERKQFMTKQLPAIIKIQVIKFGASVWWYR